ncbi:MAG: GGDEF domain-containing protein [Solirubrobacteraceae bacterium]|nr:GGDEF domain-containing protein [Solirubrobacteraceae bacterium]
MDSTESERLRQRELERRIMPVKYLLAAVLWIGLALLAIDAPLDRILQTAALGALYLPLLAYTDRRTLRSRAPLAWLVLQEIGVMVLLCFVVWWSGGMNSAAMPMILLIGLFAGARFPVAWLVPLVVCSMALMGAATILGGWQIVRDDPIRWLSWEVALPLAATVSWLLASAERRARDEAVRDALTGTLNRNALEARLADEHRHDSRRAETISVIVADLDGFKTVNDTYGHDAGDDVLRAVATTLHDAIRAGDLLYRLGGDEFLVVLPVTPTSEAVALAERLRAMVEAEPPAGHGITLSLGVAGVVHERVALEDLITRADRALYVAKDDGRNLVRLAEPEHAPLRAISG